MKLGNNFFIFLKSGALWNVPVLRTTVRYVALIDGVQTVPGTSSCDRINLE